MTPDTRKEYHKKANYHIGVWQQKYHHMSLADYMRMIASRIQPDSWRGVRVAIATLLEDAINDEAVIKKGHFDHETALSQISKLKHPHAGEKAVKRKTPGLKKVSEIDQQKIANALDKNALTDRQLACMLTFLYLTGVRPCEVLNASYNQDKQIIYIKGAKKTDDGQRGADRELIISDERWELTKKVMDILSEGVLSSYRKIAHERGISDNVASKSEMDDVILKEAKTRFQKRLAKKLDEVTNKVWPRRKKQITFLTYRHQMSSNLKHFGLDPIEIAAFFGHQSIKSQDRYGNSRSGGRQPEVHVDEMSQEAVRVRELKPWKSAVEKDSKAEAPKVPESSTLKL